MRLAADPEGGEIELGGGLSAVCESGFVRFEVGAEEAAPEPAALRLPGRATIGRWEVRAELHPAPVEAAGPERATLDAAALGGQIEVRTWREGDRIRPLGMDGTKTLQDLFTDRGVPRSIRRTIPVVTVDGEVAWVAGVAVSEDFRLRAATEEVAVLSARVLG
jgi:tRNA(Ile)-lysidine synthase